MRKNKPQHPGYINSHVEFNCDYCGATAYDKKSHFNKKKRHYCCMSCYTKDRKENWKKEEQPTFGSGHSIEERKRRAKCRNKTNKAILRGDLKRLPCEVCGDVKSEAHHYDYGKPYKVQWLCFKHHRKLHETPELLENN